MHAGQQANADYEFARRAYQGALRALRECLAVRAGESVALFFDEETAEFANIMTAAAGELQLVVESRFVPAARQVALARVNQLANEDEDAIDGARAVVIAFGPVNEAMAYRRRLLNRAVDASRYVGVIPGANLELLACGVDIDYASVQAKCDDLAVAFMAGEHAELITRHPRTPNQVETLHIDLGSFARPPITSTGMIQRGAWGNLPGGETFIAPIEHRARGCFVLNGAFRGHVLDPENPLVLTFDGGWLVRVLGPEDSLTAFLQMLHWDPPESPSHLQLAELGVGVNEGLFELTGNALFDEKAAGTAHIAVGENTVYGGTLQSSVHEDFVARNPSLQVDGLPILDRGLFVLDPAQWRESVQTVLTMPVQLAGDCEISRTGLHAHRTAENRFCLRRDVGTHRKCIYTVGDIHVSPLLCSVYELVPVYPLSISLSELRQAWERRYGPEESRLLRGLVAILEKHHVVECSSFRD